MIDKLAQSTDARPLGRVRGLSAGKTGGLADVAGALPPALAPPRHRRCARCCPAIPAVMAALGDAASRPRLSPTCSAARRGCSPASVDGPRPPRARRAAPLRPARQPLCRTPTARDWPDNWRRFARARPRRRRHRQRRSCPTSCPTSCTRTTGRPALAPAYLRYYGVAAAVDRADHPQPRLPGPVPAPTSSPTLRAAAAGLRHRRRRVLRRRRLPEGRAAARRRDHHGQPDLRRGDHARRTTAWGSKACLRAAPASLHGIVNGIDTDVWNPETDPHLAAPFYGREARSGRAEQPRGARGALRPRRRRRRRSSCVVSRLTWQKGIDLLAWITADDIVARRRAARRARHRRARPRDARFRALAAEFPGRVGVVIGYDEPLVAPDAGRRRRHPHPVALRALRPDPALRPALRLRPDRRPRRRPRRHGHRRQRSPR